MTNLANKTEPKSDFSEFSLDDYPLYNLNRTSATYANEMSAALQTIGMDQTQWRILGILGDKNNSTVSEIARRGVIKISTVTRMLERMERDNLLMREPWAKDKRIVRVSLTPEGHVALNAALAIWANIHSAATQGISQPDMTIFIDTLKKIRENLGRNRYSQKPRDENLHV